MEPGFSIALARILIVVILVTNLSVDARIIEWDIYEPDTINEVRSNNMQSKKWFDGQIPYVIDKSISTPSNSSLLFQVKEAMNDIQFSTYNCIHFYPKKSTDLDYINITSADSGCYSSVGRTGGSQPVNIGVGCNTTGIIIHELLHALGFWHEHSRTDRDNYVDIKLNNMITGSDVEFEKRIDTAEVVKAVKYDFRSILHYKYNQFAKARYLDTIVPNAEYDCSINPRNEDCVYKTVLGQRFGLSQLDIERIEWLYECKDTRHYCQKPDIHNNDISVQPSRTSYEPGSVIKFECPYISIGPKSSTCLPGRKWSGATPSCLEGTFLDKVYYCDMGDDCFAKMAWFLPTNPANGISWKRAWNVTLGYGPNVDHTYQNNTVLGSFLMVDLPAGVTSGMSFARTPTLRTLYLTYCLMFYYYMYGAITETSKLFVDYKYGRTIVQTGSTAEPIWYLAIIRNNMRIGVASFVADITLTGGPYGVAIDDILIGQCHDVDNYKAEIDKTDDKPMEIDSSIQRFTL